MYQGELHDFLVDLIVREAKKMEGHEVRTRRQDLCQALMEVNPKIGEGDSLKTGLKTIVTDWQATPEQIDALEKLGFSCNKENKKKHYRVWWKDWRKYAGTLPASPSDHRAWKNSWSNLKNMFF